jgi:hypothetical protein
VEIAGSGDEQSGADFAPSSEAGKDTVSVHPMHGFSGRRREIPVRGAGYEPEMSSSQSQVFSRWSWVGRHGSHKGIVIGRQPRRVASPEQRTEDVGRPAQHSQHTSSCAVDQASGVQKVHVTLAEDRRVRTRSIDG